MILEPIFQPFLQQRPICVMARAVLERLFDPQRLDQLFEVTSQRQYTHRLLFSTLAELMSQVVLGVHPSVHAAVQTWRQRLPVGDDAVYGKLQNIELAVSQALVRDAAQQVAPVLRALGAELPSWLPGYHIKILDGNHLEATEHRLKELRTTWAAPLPGKGLVVLDQPTMTVTDLLLTENGQAQERSLLPEVLPLVQPGDLWLGDRNFCTLGFLFGITDRPAHFLLRQHGTVQGALLGERHYRERCATGQVYEQPLQLRHASGRVRVVRRISVVLDQPTRDGDTEIHLLTNLPAAVSAVGVAELYQKRWTVEGLFLEVAQTLHSEINTLAYPKAALFALSLGFVACNAVALLKGALRAVHGAEVVQEQVSGYYLALEIKQTYDGMMVAIPEEHWAVFGRLRSDALATVLRTMAEHVSLPRYRKHPRGPKKKPPKRQRYENGAHVATAKLLAARKRNQ